MIEPLSAKQRHTFANAVCRINIAEGAVRSGKTVGIDFKWMECVRHAPRGVDLLMVGKTERTLKRNIINPIIEMVGPSRARYVAGEGEFHLFGRRIYVVGANDESAENKIRGMSLYAAYGDEMTIWPQSFWEMLKSRLSEPGARFYGTTNPGTPTHWLKLELDRAEHRWDRNGVYRHRDPLDEDTLIDWFVTAFKIEDNEYLMRTNPAYVASLKREYRGLWYRRFILGEWVAADGAIYPMWDDETMVVDTLPPIVMVISNGIDYGTDHPTAGVNLGLGADGCLYVTREWAPKVGSSDAHLITDLGAWRQGAAMMPLSPGEGAAPMYTFVDPAGASLKREMKVQRYARVLNGHNTPVVDGLRVIGALFDRGLLKVHRSCHNTIREAGGYVWDADATKRGKDAPLKQNDDWMDALRYAVFSSRSIWLHRLREQVITDVDAAA